MSDPKKTINGVLVSFSFGFMSGSKRDPTITSEVLEGKHAEDGAGSWSNKLFPPKTCGKKNSFTRLKHHLGQMRGWVYSNTYVFEEKAWRILPERRVEAFKQHVEIDGAAHGAVLLNAFIEDLPNLIDLARIGRGDAFKESDYPHADEVRLGYKYVVDYRPVPKSEDLNPALMQEAIDRLNQLHQQRLVEANQELVRRFLEPFQTLAEQLKDTKQRKLGPVLETIREFVDVIPSLDLSGNEELLALAAQVGATFEGITPEAIKSDEEIQKRLGQTTEGVIQVLGGFQRKFA